MPVALCSAILMAAAMVSVGAAGAGPIVSVRATGHTQKDIYHSPETPGYTAWVGLHLLRGDRLECDFVQQTGPLAHRALSIVSLGSRDRGETWTRLREVPTGPQDGLVVYETPDGVIVARPRPTILPGNLALRCAWASADSEAGWLQRSTDGGVTWGDRIYVLPASGYRVWPTNIRPLRDGRLVLMAGVWKRGDGASAGSRMAKMMFVSRDRGLTWGAPIPLVPVGDGVCEESDFCELPGGDLFWVHRSEHNPEGAPGYSDRMQSITRRQGDTFVPGPASRAPFPHSGYPAVLYTREGVILHLATDGVYWSADRGAKWTRLDIPGTPYYPKAVQLRDGRIVCMGHVGSDDYYGKVDQRIVQQTFRREVTRSR